MLDWVISETPSALKILGNQKKATNVVLVMPFEKKINLSIWYFIVNF